MKALTLVFLSSLTVSSVALAQDADGDFGDLPEANEPDPLASTAVTPVSTEPTKLMQVRARLGLAADHAPLTGGYPIAITATEPDAVLIDLPILLATNATDVREAFDLIVAISAGGELVRTARQHIEPASLPTRGPAWTFVKTLVPTAGDHGVIEVSVSTADTRGRETKHYTESVRWTQEESKAR